MKHDKKLAPISSGEFKRVLFQLFAIPFVCLVVLALATVFTLGRIENKVLWVDHSDEVISHINRLQELMVDQQTSLRAYAPTQIKLFLQRYNDSADQIASEFSQLNIQLADNPDQIERLNRIKSGYQSWNTNFISGLRSQLAGPELSTLLLSERAQMDDLRQQFSALRAREEDLRTDRMDLALRLRKLSVPVMVLLAILIAMLIALQSTRAFEQLSSLFSRQLQEVELQRTQTYDREQRLNTILRSIGDAVIVCGPAGLVEYMNPVAEKLTGWTEAESTGNDLAHIFKITHEESGKTVANPVQQVIATGKTVRLSSPTILTARDGTELNIDDSAAPICSPEGHVTGVVLIFRDITEKLANQAAMMRADKLASAGRLSAAIAHEINNPLESLTNLIYLARSESNPGDLNKNLAQAEIELSRIAHITRQSLGFYKGTENIESFDPAQICMEICSLYSPRAATRNVKIRCHAATGIIVSGSSGELRQVISNVVANALDAVRQSGKVRITMRSAPSPDGGVPGIEICVGDNGSGIPAKNLDRVFDPFYTTKGTTGTGLGLWVSRQLIEKRGGTVTVTSRFGGSLTGTRFRIWFPLQAPAVPSTSEPLKATAV